jgi:hypothetical protein
VRERGQVKQFSAAGRRDGFGGGGGNHSTASLGAREGRFEIQDGLDGSGIAEEGFDGRRAEETVQELHA